MNRLLNTSGLARKLGTLLVLSVFVLAITPKITLHNWFAHHTDTPSSGTATTKTEIGKAGYHCNVDNVVAEGHFLATSVAQTIQLHAISSFTTYRLPVIHFAAIPPRSPRGPPLDI